MANDNSVKPAYTARSACSCTIFTANFPDLVTDFIMQFCRERTIAHTDCVCFTDSNHMVDLRRTYTRTDCNSTCNRVGRSDEWVCSLIDIKHDTLCPFE